MPPDADEIKRHVANLEAAGEALRSLGAQFEKPKTRAQMLYEHALAAIGTDASPVDVASDDLGCAESVSNLISKVISFPIITGTWTLWDVFRRDKRFEEVSEYGGRGIIVICATGTGNGKIRGHVGILGENKEIMSSSSETGLWGVFYNIKTWKKRYGDIGDFTTFYFRMK